MLVGEGEVSMSQLKLNTLENYTEDTIDVEVPITLNSSTFKLCGQVNTKLFFIRNGDHQNSTFNQVLTDFANDADLARNLASEQYEKMKKRRRRQNSLDIKNKKKVAKNISSGDKDGDCDGRGDGDGDQTKGKGRKDNSPPFQDSPKRYQVEKDEHEEGDLSSLNYSPSPNKLDVLSSFDNVCEPASPTHSNNMMMMSIHDLDKSVMSSDEFPAILKEVSLASERRDDDGR